MRCGRAPERTGRASGYAIPALLASLLWGACSDPAAADPEQVCNEVASATCDKLNQCSPPEVLSLYGDVATCVTRVKLRCLPMLRATGSKTTPAIAQECGQKMRAATCDVFFAHNLPAACLGLPGTVADGAACSVGAQCASTYCKVASGAVCGVCAQRASSGGACTEEDGCAMSLTCASGVCVPFGAVGSACNKTQPCRRDLICRGGTCARPLEAGQPCDTMTQECNTLAGLYCAKTKLCVQAKTAKAGEACGLLTGGEVAICSGGAVCTLLVNGLCQAFAPDGAACDSSKGPHCLNPATCVGGVCTLADSAVCP